MSPALTLSPSRTLSSPTTPPVGCWTFLTFESTTTRPDAITAPASSVVAASPPTPPASKATMAIPQMRWRWIERCDLAFASKTVLLKLRRPLARRHPRQAAALRRPRPRRAHRGALHDLAQHLALRPEGLHPSLTHDEQIVDGGEGARTVRHHDDDLSARPRGRDRGGQRLLALGIEVRVRLVEHDQERIAVERAGKCDALALPCRKR